MKARPARAFTLVELLVVVSIIAMLVALIMPTLGRARDLARKSLCATQLKAYAGAIQAYVTAHGMYPRLGGDYILGQGGPGAIDVPYTKMYTVMEQSGITVGGRKLNGWYYYDKLIPEDVWPKALCPAMDPGPIWDQAMNEAGANVPQNKPSSCLAGVGYQWNVTLRGREWAGRKMPFGRFPANLVRLQREYSASEWTTWYLELRDSQLYVTQAINPQEIENPSYCAEAWDGMDIDSVHKDAYWGNSAIDWDACDYGESLVPGWTVGPQTLGTNGWALLPADRHPGGSPNILYADGSVRADATRRIILEEDIPGIDARLGANREIHLISWDDYEPELYGTIPHLLPRRKIIPAPW